MTSRELKQQLKHAIPDMAATFRLNDMLNDTVFVDLKTLQTPKFFDEIDNRHLSDINKTLTLYYNDEMLNNKYTQTLITKAMSAYQELKLIAQAASI